MVRLLTGACALLATACNGPVDHVTVTTTSAATDAALLVTGFIREHQDLDNPDGTDDEWRARKEAEKPAPDARFFALHAFDQNPMRLIFLNWVSVQLTVEVPVLAAAVGTGEHALSVPPGLPDSVDAQGFLQMTAVAFLDLDADGALDLSSTEPSEPARLFTKDVLGSNAVLRDVTVTNDDGLYLTSLSAPGGASTGINEVVGADGWAVDVPDVADPAPGT